MPIPSKLTFRPEEIAGIFGISRRTVYRWIKSGRIDAVRVNKKGGVRIPRTAIIDILGKDI